MREIKFRGWERDLKVMVYSDELCGHTEYSCNPVKAINVILNENDDGYVYMQYTGKSDRAGKDIYEGDVVEFSDLETDIIIVGEVVFNFCQWSVRCIETDVGYNLDGISYKNLRVVGNIYEDKC